MDMRVEMPLDDDGYVDRECPACRKPFRCLIEWSSDTPTLGADLDVFHCPYCGMAAEADQWWTPEQVEYLRSSAITALMPEIEGQLRDLANSISQTGYLSAEFKAPQIGPARPIFVEDLETTTVASPCHPGEPVKLIGEWQAPIHCFECGAEYAV